MGVAAGEHDQHTERDRGGNYRKASEMSHGVTSASDDNADTQGVAPRIKERGCPELEGLTAPYAQARRLSIVLAPWRNVDARAPLLRMTGENGRASTKREGDSNPSRQLACHAES